MTNPPQQSDGTADEQVQVDVMRFLMPRYPAHVALDELRRELAGPVYGLYGRDEVERVARNLVRAGLHRAGELVFLTLAAMHMQRLPTF